MHAVRQTVGTGISVVILPCAMVFTFVLALALEAYPS